MNRFSSASKQNSASGSDCTHEPNQQSGTGTRPKPEPGPKLAREYTEPDWEKISFVVFTKEQLLKKSKKDLIRIYLETQDILVRIIDDAEGLGEELENAREQNRTQQNERFGKSSQKSDSGPSASEPDEGFGLSGSDAGFSAGSGSIKKEKEKPRRSSGCINKVIENLPTYRVEVTMTPEQLKEEFGDYTVSEMEPLIRRTVIAVPARFYVKEEIIHVYSANHKIRNAKDVDSSKLQGYLSSSLLAWILEQKFYLGEPVHRIANHLQMDGFNLHPQTVDKWIIDYALKYFEPLVRRFLLEICKAMCIQCDETFLRVLESVNEKSYFWQITNSALCDCHDLVVYFYDESRSAEVLEEYIGTYCGALIADGYDSYPAFVKSHPEIILAICFQHCRSRFFKACHSFPGIDQMTDEEKKKVPAWQGLKMIDNIFREEHKLIDLTPEERLAKRQSIVAPLVDEFFTWVNSFTVDDVIEGSNLAKALRYAHDHEDGLRVFLSNPYVPVHNSRCEQNFVTPCIGRNNWKSITSIDGAFAAGLCYSIVQSCKMNDANVRVYFNFLLDNLVKRVDDHLRKLDELSEAIKKLNGAEKEAKKAQRKELEEDLSYLDGLFPYDKAFKDYIAENSRLEIEHVLEYAKAETIRNNPEQCDNSVKCSDSNTENDISTDSLNEESKNAFFNDLSEMQSGEASDSTSDDAEDAPEGDFKATKSQESTMAGRTAKPTDFEFDPASAGETQNHEATMPTKEVFTSASGSTAAVASTPDPGLNRAESQGATASNASGHAAETRSTTNPTSVGETQNHGATMPTKESAVSTSGSTVAVASAPDPGFTRAESQGATAPSASGYAAETRSASDPVSAGETHNHGATMSTKGAADSTSSSTVAVASAHDPGLTRAESQEATATCASGCAAETRSASGSTSVVASTLDPCINLDESQETSLPRSIGQNLVSLTGMAPPGNAPESEKPPGPLPDKPVIEKGQIAKSTASDLRNTDDREGTSVPKASGINQGESTPSFESSTQGSSAPKIDESLSGNGKDSFVNHKPARRKRMPHKSIKTADSSISQVEVPRIIVVLRNKSTGQLTIQKMSDDTSSNVESKQSEAVES